MSRDRCTKQMHAFEQSKVTSLAKIESDIAIVDKQGRGRRLVKFSYLNHPTKVDVTSGQIGAQQLVSA